MDERELLLLGLLRTEPMHGHRLYDLISRYLSTCTDLKKPNTYRLLDQMVERGWLDAETELDPASKRPPRRTYSITPAGSGAFDAQLRDNLAHAHEDKFAGDVGLAFLDVLPPAEARALLQNRLIEMQRTLDVYLGAPAHSGSLQLVIDHAQHHLRSELEWLRRLLERYGDPTE